MFIAKISFKEANKMQNIEVKDDDVFRLLRIIANLEDLVLTEVHIYREVV